MLGVLLTLLYTHTMPNIYYCSTCMLLIPPLDGQTCPEVGWKSRFFPDLRQEIRQHGAVKVWWRALQSCWECSLTLLYTHTMPNIYYCSTCMLLYPHLMAKLALKLAGKSRFFPDLRHEIRQHGAVKVWWRALQSCWECSLTLLYTYTMPNIYYCSTCMLLYPHLMAKLALKLAEIEIFS